MIEGFKTWAWNIYNDDKDPFLRLKCPVIMTEDPEDIDSIKGRVTCLGQLCLYYPLHFLVEEAAKAIKVGTNCYQLWNSNQEERTRRVTNITSNTYRFLVSVPVVHLLCGTHLFLGAVVDPRIAISLYPKDDV